MKKISKSLPPNELTKFAESNPGALWDPDFRDHKAGESYKSVREVMVQDQGGLCGYCEKKISKLPAHKQRIEHYHNKSDTDDPTINWGLDWNNVFAVCLGGSEIKDEEKKQYPLPRNLSCDAYKEHMVCKNLLPQACEGYFLNPLKIIANPCLFGFDKSNGELTVNKSACEALVGIDNQYGTIEELVEKTITILNLNCDRLCSDRLAVLKLYNQEVTKARKAKDREGLSKLAKRWFDNKWPSFFTTKRVLLGTYAEAFLTQSSYDG
ncbi:retron system putative HNH endonuclease [Vibrio sp. 1F148]|uniref:retron system putative HNH endonuclease n=1 Tax=Vibrio sp. 1F148 TaxID=3230003 RepID=UPI00352BE364